MTRGHSPAGAERQDGFTSAATAIDGRVRRGQQTRAAIADALIALYREGVIRPTAAQVAERGGIAPRSVFHHFKDMEQLYTEVSRRHFERIRHLATPPVTEGGRRTRIVTIVGHRAELFETIAPVRRVGAAQMYESPTLTHSLALVAAAMRAVVAETFAPEISSLADTARNDRLDALDLLLSWETWERLRTVQTLSVAQTKRLLVHTIDTLCAKNRPRLRADTTP